MAEVLALDAVRRAELRKEPYAFFLGSDFVKSDRINALRDSFPAITKPGFLTVDEVELEGPFKTLVDELEGPELTAVLSDKFGQDLNPLSAADDHSQSLPAQGWKHPHRRQEQGDDTAAVHER